MPRSRSREVADGVSEAQHLDGEPALAWRGLRHRAWSEAYRIRRQATPSWRRWGAVLLAVVVSGPVAILAALYENSTSGVGFVLVAVVVAPLVEEIVKGAGALYLAEERPWLVPSAWVLPVVAVLSGLVFASIENWWYLEVLIEDPTDRIVRWRWTFGPLVHGVGSLLVGIGAARMWQRMERTGEPPGFDTAQRFIVVAAVLHGSYNLTALLLAVSGVTS